MCTTGTRWINLFCGSGPGPERVAPIGPMRFVAEGKSRARFVRPEQGRASVLTDALVQMWPIARLVPYARHPRKNDAAVDRMAASIQQFGFKIPILGRRSGEIVDRRSVPEGREAACHHRGACDSIVEQAIAVVFVVEQRLHFAA